MIERILKCLKAFHVRNDGECVHSKSDFVFAGKVEIKENIESAFSVSDGKLTIGPIILFR